MTRQRKYLIALGGEVANALEADGALAGLLVLGPKRSGMPYEAEEIAFLGALSSVAALTLHSAGIQQTLELLRQKRLRAIVSRTFRLDELETAHELLRENAIVGRAALVLDPD